MGGAEWLLVLVSRQRQAVGGFGPSRLAPDQRTRGFLAPCCDSTGPDVFFCFSVVVAVVVFSPYRSPGSNNGGHGYIGHSPSILVASPNHFGYVCSLFSSLSVGD